MPNKYTCSNGDRVTQATINRRLTECYKRMGDPRLPYPVDHDHTISQARCKTLHKTELIWSPDNIEFSSREKHTEWEGYKSGKFAFHENVVNRMFFVKKHDREGFMKRLLSMKECPVELIK